MTFLFGFIVGLIAGLVIAVVAICSIIYADHKTEINNP